VKRSRLARRLGYEYNAWAKTPQGAGLWSVLPVMCEVVAETEIPRVGWCKR